MIVGTTKTVALHLRRRRHRIRGGSGLKRRRDGLDRSGTATHVRVVHCEQRCRITRKKLREFDLATRLVNRLLSNNRYARCCMAASIACRHGCATRGTRVYSGAPLLQLLPLLELT